MRFVLLRYPGGEWNPRPGALRVLAQEVAFRTSIETNSRVIARSPDAPDLFEDPLLLLTGDRAFPPFSEAQITRLRHHIEAGGTLLVDNGAETEALAGGFERSIRRLIERLFPGHKLHAISSEHVIYRSFYRLDHPWGRNLRKGYMEGLAIGGRLGIIYSPNDLGGALDQDSFGVWSHDMIPGDRRQREMAIRMSVNLIMYGLCLHYKDDQVHLRYLLKRRKWRIRPPNQD